ncbi:protein of unknown function [Acidithiobacillus ferrivorans]|uniref:Uncharacterized protein n=1 Tax=Acidithiobacillus ferrivorans TaxID=160808 RepID=A0A060UTQ2_9PROT|nr:hypothetical protein AFERRI_370043 [Acidithiobacillus ferrivorans]SMH65733.1 protein of unknown function [Acidithiobacillus ferrivorans]
MTLGLHLSQGFTAGVKNKYSLGFGIEDAVILLPYSQQNELPKTHSRSLVTRTLLLMSLSHTSLFCLLTIHCG